MMFFSGRVMSTVPELSFGALPCVARPLSYPDRKPKLRQNKGVLFVGGEKG